MNSEVLDAVRQSIVGFAQVPLPQDDEEFLRLHLQDDLGLDSLDTVAFYFDVEERLGRRISEEDIEPRQLNRMSNLVDYLCSVE